MPNLWISGTCLKLTSMTNISVTRFYQLTTNADPKCASPSVQLGMIDFIVSETEAAHGTHSRHVTRLKPTGSMYDMKYHRPVIYIWEVQESMNYMKYWYYFTIFFHCSPCASLSCRFFIVAFNSINCCVPWL